MKYKAAIFDLFGTLLQNIRAYSEKRERVLLDMAKILLVPSQEFVKLWNVTFDRRLSGHFPTIESNIEWVCGALGSTVGTDQIEKAVRIRLEFIKSAFLPRDDVVQLLASLRQSGLKTGLVSDATPDVPSMWQSSPLSPLFDATVFSCLVGVKKPDPEIYWLICERLAVAPTDCFYVGDHVFELEGAARVGIHPVLLRVKEEDEYYSDRDEWKGPVLNRLQHALRLVNEH